MLSSRIAAACAGVFVVFNLSAAESETEQLRAELRALREAYEMRAKELEARLEAVEARRTEVRTNTGESAANPALSLIVSGRYASLSESSGTYAIDGFAPSFGEIAPAGRGFSLGESELRLTANIDGNFRGDATFALAEEDGEGVVEIEEVFFQTLALPAGLTLKGGRFLSALGYLNEQHAHAWSFEDQPLIYKAFFGNQLGADGIQLRWIAPADLLLELGAELGNGHSLPGGQRDKNGTSTGVLFANAGGDLNDTTAWRIGVSALRASPKDRESIEVDSRGAEVSNNFSGSSRYFGLSAVLKHYPEARADGRWKLSGEYFHRNESGKLVYDANAVSAGPVAGDFESKQSGWYAQGSYQLTPTWWASARIDRLAYGSVRIEQIASGVLTINDFPALGRHDPRRFSLAVDYLPSEFSRLRLQFAADEARAAVRERQLFLSYTFSLGAHGAHKF